MPISFKRYQKNSKCVGCKACARDMSFVKINGDFTFNAMEGFEKVCPFGAIEEIAKDEPEEPSSKNCPYCDLAENHSISSGTWTGTPEWWKRQREIHNEHSDKKFYY